MGCKTSAFGDEPRRMLKVIQRFDKHCSCHIQGKYVLGVFIYIRLPKNAQNIFALKMATAIFAETLDNFQPFDAAHPRKLKFYTELQPRKPKDKHYNESLLNCFPLISSEATFSGELLTHSIPHPPPPTKKYK
jgi:hypothetical protein